MRNSLSCVSYKDRKAVAADMKKIYKSATKLMCLATEQRRAVDTAGERLEESTQSVCHYVREPSAGPSPTAR